MVRLHPHARERMHERGATEEEIKPLSHKGSSSQRSLGARAFDGTFNLTRNGMDGITVPSRSKSMPFRKALTGW